MTTLGVTLSEAKGLSNTLVRHLHCNSLAAQCGARVLRCAQHDISELE